MTVQFQKAIKEATFARVALLGPTGSGKSYTALLITQAWGGKTAAVDTEHRTLRKYADIFTHFDVIEPESFSVETYIEAIKSAEAAGYDNLIIDSLSHAWAGKDGLLEFVDKHASDTARRNQSKADSFAAWRKATPKHNELVETMLACKLHLLVTMRVKMDYVVEKDEKGKTTVRKIGLQPVQRDGLEYEFDVIGDMDQDNVLTISKTRCSALAGKIIEKPGKEFADTIKKWVQGAPPAPRPSKANGGEYLTDLHRERLKEAAATGGVPPLTVQALIREHFGVDNSRQVLVTDFDKLLALIENAQPAEAKP